MWDRQEDQEMLANIDLHNSLVNHYGAKEVSKDDKCLTLINPWNPQTFIYIYKSGHVSFGFNKTTACKMSDRMKNTIIDKKYDLPKVVS